MIPTMKIQNLLRKNGILLTAKQQGLIHPKTKLHFLTNSLESSLCDYSYAYILVTGNINVTGGNANTKVAFKNCVPFKECKTEINKTF